MGLGRGGTLAEPRAPWAEGVRRHLGSRSRAPSQHQSLHPSLAIPPLPSPARIRVVFSYCFSLVLTSRWAFLKETLYLTSLP